MHTIRLWRPGSVAHLTPQHDSVRGWTSRCPFLWYGSKWVGHDQPGGARLVTLPDGMGHGAGRALHIVHLRDLPVEVKLCRYCVARFRSDADDLDRAIAARA